MWLPLTFTSTQSFSLVLDNIIINYNFIRTKFQFYELFFNPSYGSLKLVYFSWIILIDKTIRLCHIHIL